MADPSGFSLETIRDFIVLRGGRVTNHELVKHFKSALTNPQSQNEARNQFKEIVNTLATITRNEEGEKYLVLKKKFRPDGGSKPGPSSPMPSHSRALSSASFPDSDPADGNAAYVAMRVPSYDAPPPPLPTSPVPELNRRSSDESSVFYDCPPTPQSSRTVSTPGTSLDVNPSPIMARAQMSYEAPVSGDDTPPVPPRRKSSDKIRVDNKENEEFTMRRPKPITADPEAFEALVEDSKISVKECTQKFNKMALESNQLNKVQIPKKRPDKANAERDDDDTGSNTLLDARSREWLIRAAQSNYQSLAKMASENPKLVRIKDPTNGYTALHWAAKHGNVDVIKLIAGTHGADVNKRTNGGYTALHIAMQFGHKEVYNILVNVYDADKKLRDWSGKLAEQYLPGKSTSVTVDTMRRYEKRSRRGNKGKEKTSSGKRLGFLEDWIAKCPSETNY